MQSYQDCESGESFVSQHIAIFENIYFDMYCNIFKEALNDLSSNFIDFWIVFYQEKLC